MLTNVDAVIFDMDGTLIDSMWMWEDIDIEFLGKHGIQMPSTLQKDIEGQSITQTAIYFIETFNLKYTVDELKDIWNNMAIEAYKHKVPAKPGVIEFLKELKSRNIKIGVATSNSTELMNVALEGCGLKEYVEVAFSGCMIPNGKPAPDIYLITAEHLGVEPSRCLCFEDVGKGLEAGRAAGMKCAAIYDESCLNTKEEMLALSDYYFNDFYEVLDKVR